MSTSGQTLLAPALAVTISLALAGTGCESTSDSQWSQPFELSGVVNDSAGAPICGADVEALGDHRPVASGRTDARGIAKLRLAADARVQWLLARKPGVGFERLLTPREVADGLRVSLSWLAKARMRGDGPPFTKIGRGIKYPESELVRWMLSKQRLSTAER